MGARAIAREKRALPIWRASVPPLESDGVLGADKQADVCIIGAGITGLTTAYLLLQEGRSVTVLDDGPVGGGETQHTSAHLSSVLDRSYLQIERMRGIEAAQRAGMSHRAAINCIERIILDEGIECGFERVHGFLFGEENEESRLDEEYAAAQRAGVPGVTKMDQIPGLLIWKKGIRFADQAQFHPLQYLAGLAEAVRRSGGHIYTGTHADRIRAGNHPSVTTAQGHTVRCRQIVVATHSPVHTLLSIHLKQAPYRSYVTALRLDVPGVEKGLYWDLQDPFHYVRVERRGGEDFLIVGGEDHKTGQADDAARRFWRLENWARARFPIQAGPAAYHWSGQLMETPDGLAYIGPTPRQKNVYLATGDCGNGLTHGTVAGMLLTDLLSGRKNEWSELYSPSRRPIRAFRRAASEALNATRQYRDWFKRGSDQELWSIPVGAGKIIQRNLTQIAVHHHPEGVFHFCSAVCPHLGGVVRWNTSESSWDCPCHGSRFDAEGRVLNGPANKNLAPWPPVEADLGEGKNDSPSHGREGRGLTRLLMAMLGSVLFSIGVVGAITGRPFAAGWAVHAALLIAGLAVFFLSIPPKRPQNPSF